MYYDPAQPEFTVALDAFFARGDWFTEFQRVLKQIESQIEGKPFSSGY